MLLGHELTLNPFYSTDAYRELARLPLEERIAALRLPEVRARALAEPVDPDPANVLGRMVRDYPRMYVLGDPPNYEPLPEDSIAARAERAGVSPDAVAYDLLLEGDGRNMLYYALANYTRGSLEDCLAMMRHPGSVLGLGDGGAHCATICDGSLPTFMLTHWTRDRSRGERLPRDGARRHRRLPRRRGDRRAARAAGARAAAARGALSAATRTPSPATRDTRAACRARRAYRISARACP